MERLDNLVRFYQILSNLESRLGGKRRLADCHGKMGWPRRGVYFFFEDGERRSHSGEGLRVARVGTHAVAGNQDTKFWGRLCQHRGSVVNGCGNHRASVFRRLVGAAIKCRDDLPDIESWGKGTSAIEAERKTGIPKDVLKACERPLESTVSQYIRSMPFLWIAADDPPGPESNRAVIERNSVALLSNYAKNSLDPPSSHWLGSYSSHRKVKESGLWNNDYVNDRYESQFLDLLEKLGADTRRLI